MNTVDLVIYFDKVNLDQVQFKLKRNQNQETNEASPYHRFQNHTISSHRRCSVKKVFLKTLQISQEKTCIGISFDKAAGLKAIF